MIRLIVDSTCDISPKSVEKYQIIVLPLHVLIKDKEYIDGVTIRTKDVYDVMRRGIQPKTSQIDYSDTLTVLKGLLDEGDDLICLSFSSRMSGTCDLITSIMNDLSLDYPERRLTNLDSKGGSYATGLIALDICRRIEAGVAYTHIVHRAEYLISQVEHVFCISDLNWMVKGGRISRTRGYSAGLLNIKPILDVKDGEMEVIEKVRGQQKALERVADIVAERAAECPRQTIGITHADDLETAQYMKELLMARLPECRFKVKRIGAVLGVHIGIGGVGVFFFRHR